MADREQNRLAAMQAEDMQTAVQCLQAGKLAEADRLCGRILETDSDFVPALSLRGVVAIQAGDVRAALGYIEHALRIDPDNVQLCRDYGKVLCMSGRPGDGVASCRKATDLDPEDPSAWLDLGGSLVGIGRVDEAMQAFHQALSLDPAMPEAHFNLGLLLAAQRNYRDAAAHYRDAVRLRAGHAKAWNNLGSALRSLGRFDEAMSCFKTALQIDSAFENAHMNIGLTLQQQGRLREALPHYEAALRLAPGYAGAIYNKAICRLLGGDLSGGWEGFGWRWKMDELLGRKGEFAGPEWHGSPAAGRTILVYTEQGVGDAFQFIRYVPLLLEQGFRVVLQCESRIARILGTVDETIRIVNDGSEDADFQTHAALMDLPRLFGTRLDTIPHNVPYLHADTPRIERWQRAMGTTDALKVGICWRGNPEHRNDMNRSFELERFLPFAEMSGIRLFSLQKVLSEEDAQALRACHQIIELGSSLDPGADQYLDTAAVIQNLDLVITADTSVAHLAGALARPVWVLLPFAPDWRWMLERSDSPWYPTMRLFRQGAFGDWNTVFANVKAALQERIAGSGANAW